MLSSLGLWASALHVGMRLTFYYIIICLFWFKRDRLHKFNEKRPGLLATHSFLLHAPSKRQTC